MALELRNINNTGEPLCAPDGTLLTGVMITFTLTQESGLYTDAWDGYTFERVVGIKSVVTDMNAEFSVDLWPNDRGSEVTQYLCHVDHPSVRDFYAPLPSGPTGLTWVQFKGGAVPQPPVPPDALAQHVASPTAHPNATPLINGFMSAADKAKLDTLTSDGIAMQAEAGEAIGGHRAVILDAAGLAFYADQSDPTHLGLVAGVTEGAAILGDQVSIFAKGRLVEPSWTWTPFQPIFLSTNGQLTQVAPVTGFLQVLGTALDATTMLVNPFQPVNVN